MIPVLCLDISVGENFIHGAATEELHYDMESRLFILH